jgi:DNA-binding CsgD family transcriptional regulator
MSWKSTTLLAYVAWPEEDAPMTPAVAVRRPMSGLLERHELLVGCLVMALAVGMTIPAYGFSLPVGELALGEAAAPVYALVTVAPATALTAAGVLARWSHPGSRIGVLLIVEGLIWNIGTLAYSATYIPAATEIAAMTAYVGYAIGAHILLSYPSGRLRSRSDRRLVTLLYIAFGPAIVLAYAFHASYGPGCSISAANGFLITPNDTLDVAGNVTYFALAGVLITIAGLRSVPRWRAATPLARRSLAPVYVTRWMLAGSVALWCAFGVGLIFTDTVMWQVSVGMLPQLTAIAAAGGILVVFLRSSVAHGAAGRLARELDTSPLPPGRLEQAVRSALGDPDARLLFRDDAGTTWIDSHGAPASPAAGRSITSFGAMNSSALEYDPILDDDPAIVAAVGAVAGLALEAERLRVLMRVQGDAGTPQSDGTPALRGVLTPREREVLGLVAEGLTDRAIAQRLYVTRRTVETHLGHIFTKLGVPDGSSQNRRVHAVRRYLHTGDGDTRQEPTPV